MSIMIGQTDTEKNSPRISCGVNPFSGTCSVTIPLYSPKAREVSLNLSLNYGSVSQNGEFGLGFYINIPSFTVRTDLSIPAYDGTDEFVHPKYGILTPAGGGKYLPVSESAFSKITLADGFFKEVTKDGTVSFYKNITGSDGKIFSYKITETTDIKGNKVLYSYDNNRIKSIKYGNYADDKYCFEICFNYVDRKDTAVSFRPGFGLVTEKLCRSICINHIFGDVQTVYETSFSYDFSLGYARLSKISETGFKNFENKIISESLPDLKIEYGELDYNRDYIKLNIDSTFPVSPVDLYGEGLCGFITVQNSAASYYSPAGGGNYNAAVTPANFPHCAGTPLITSLDADFNYQLVQDGGFYSLENSENDVICTGYSEFPNVPSETSFERANLYGDGMNSVLTMQNGMLRFYKSLGTKGYCAPETNALPDGFPINGDEKRAVLFANFFGDGLSHRVSVSNGNVRVFPNLGNGLFADGIDIDNAPFFGCDFKPFRVYFCDTDGSGTADLIYIMSDKAVIYRNIAGAYFDSCQYLYLPETCTDNDTVFFADMTGNGLPGLVFVKNKACGNVYYYFDFAAEDAFVPIRLDSGHGLLTSPEFVSSVKLYLEDKNAGSIWKTKPPFPIRVIKTLTTEDLLSGEINTASYSYKNGLFDKEKRRFIGFGEVSCTDRVQIQETKLNPPAKITKYSFYTGENPELNLFSETERARFGSLVSVEISDENGNVIEKTVYDYGISEILPPKNGLEGSFYVFLSSSANFFYDTCEDGIARISQGFAVSRDNYGNVLESLAIYAPMGDACPEIYITETKNNFAFIDNDDVFLAGVITQTFENAYEGTAPQGLTAPYGLSFIQDFMKTAKKLEVSGENYYYYDDEQKNSLPLGEIAAPALLYSSSKLILSKSSPLIQNIPQDILTGERGLVEFSDYYAAEAPVMVYDKTKFYLPVSSLQDNTVCTTEYDPYLLFCKKMTSALKDNTLSQSKSGEIDYQALNYSKITDENGNISESVYGALRQTVSKITYPKGGSFSYDIIDGADGADIVKNPAKYLQNADSFIFTDTLSYQKNGTPVCNIVVTNIDGVNFGITIKYLDASGRILSELCSCENNWIVQSRSVYAGKTPVLIYPAYSTNDCSFAAIPSNLYPVKKYLDVLGRVIRTEYPDVVSTDKSGRDIIGYLHDETKYSPQMITFFDKVSTLPESDYYAKYQSLAEKDENISAMINGTLKLAGRTHTTALSQRGHKLQEQVTCTVLNIFEYDAAGRLICISDEKLFNAGLKNITYEYDMAGRQILSVSADGGKVFTFFDNRGNPRYIINPQNAQIIDYDYLDRKISVTVNSSKIETISYGTDEHDGVNTIGREISRTNQSGSWSFTEYDFKGRLKKARRSLKSLTSQNNQVFDETYTYNTAGLILTREIQKDDAARFSLSASYDNAGRTISLSESGNVLISNITYTPNNMFLSGKLGNGIELSRTYNSANLSLNGLHADLNGSSMQDIKITLNPAGCVSRLQKNGIISDYTYDELYRLTDVKSDKDIHNEDYSYDSSGNLLQINRSSGENSEFEISDESNRVISGKIGNNEYSTDYTDGGNPKNLLDGLAASYDEYGRLSLLEKNSEPAAGFLYDSDGIRAVKTVYGADSKEIFSIGDFSETLCYDNGQISDSEARLRVSLGGFPLCEIQQCLPGSKTGTSRTFWLLCEHLNSVSQITDKNGTVVFSTDFSPYGETITSDGDNQGIVLGFNGREYDVESSLYYYGARYYSAGTGRMITPDSIEYASSGLNLYAYCNDNPISMTDPTGHFPGFPGLSLICNVGSRLVSFGVTITSVAAKVLVSGVTTVVVGVVGFFVSSSVAHGRTGTVVSNALTGFAASVAGSFIFGFSLPLSLASTAIGTGIGYIAEHCTGSQLAQGADLTTMRRTSAAFTMGAALLGGVFGLRFGNVPGSIVPGALSAAGTSFLTSGLFNIISGHGLPMFYNHQLDNQTIHLENTFALDVVTDRIRTDIVERYPTLNDPLQLYELRVFNDILAGHYHLTNRQIRGIFGGIDPNLPQHICTIRDLVTGLSPGGGKHFISFIPQDQLLGTASAMVMNRQSPFREVNAPGYNQVPNDFDAIIAVHGFGRYVFPEVRVWVGLESRIFTVPMAAEDFVHLIMNQYQHIFNANANQRLNIKLCVCFAGYGLQSNCTAQQIANQVPNHDVYGTVWVTFPELNNNFFQYTADNPRPLFRFDVAHFGEMVRRLSK